MTAALLDLPADIHFLIIDQLVADIDEEQSREDDGSMVLDNEVIASTRHYPWSTIALRRLRSTCKFYRDILAPRVYKTVILSNNDKSTASIREIAKGPNRELVQHFVFGGHINYEQSEESVEKAIDASTEDFLANILAHFPNVRSLCVSFSSRVNGTTLKKYFEQPEDESSASKKEAKEPWRAMAAKTLAAIAKIDNANGQIGTLEMRHLIPKPVSAYQSPDFKAFMKSLKTFDMSIWCGHDHEGGTGWNFRGYAKYLSSLHLIFENLENCTDFKFGANRLCLVGAQGHPPLDLRPGNLPKVRKMHLQHCVISTAVIAAITEHKNTLEELILEDCFSCLDLEEFDWADAFVLLSAMPTLRRVEVWPIGVPWNTGKFHGGAGRRMVEEYAWNDGDEANARRTEEELDAGGSSRRLFPYALHGRAEYNTHSKEILPSEILNRRKFLEGKDQAAWDTLTKDRETTIYDDWHRCGYDGEVLLEHSERGNNDLEKIGTNYRVGQEPRHYRRQPLPSELRRSARNKK